MRFQRWMLAGACVLSTTLLLATADRGGGAPPGGGGGRGGSGPPSGGRGFSGPPGGGHAPSMPSRTPSFAPSNVPSFSPQQFQAPKFQSQPNANGVKPQTFSGPNMTNMKPQTFSGPNMTNMKPQTFSGPNMTNGLRAPGAVQPPNTVVNVAGPGNYARMMNGKTTTAKLANPASANGNNAVRPNVTPANLGQNVLPGNGKGPVVINGNNAGRPNVVVGGPNQKGGAGGNVGKIGVPPGTITKGGKIVAGNTSHQHNHRQHYPYYHRNNFFLYPAFGFWGYGPYSYLGGLGGAMMYNSAFLGSDYFGQPPTDGFEDPGPIVDGSIKQSRRFIRVRNEMAQTLTVFLQYETMTANGEWKWYPLDPGGDEAVSYTLKSKDDAVLFHDDWPISARRIRIWAVTPDGKQLVEFRDQDLWIVEQNGGERSYMSLRGETFTFSFTE